MSTQMDEKVLTTRVSTGSKHAPSISFAGGRIQAKKLMALLPPRPLPLIDATSDIHLGGRYTDEDIPGPRVMDAV